MPNEKPWLLEPSVATWTDPHSRLKCVVIRHATLLHLCGYVRIPYSHPLYTKSNKWIERHFSPHGGVTYCRRTKAYKSRFFGRGLWVGFDCAHYGDLSPGLRTTMQGLGIGMGIFDSDVYRDMPYVIGHVTLLAEDISHATILGGYRGLRR